MRAVACTVAALSLYTADGLGILTAFTLPSAHGFHRFRSMGPGPELAYAGARGVRLVGDRRQGHTGPQQPAIPLFARDIPATRHPAVARGPGVGDSVVCPRCDAAAAAVVGRRVPPGSSPKGSDAEAQARLVSGATQEILQAGSAGPVVATVLERLARRREFATRRGGGRHAPAVLRRPVVGLCGVVLEGAAGYGAPDLCRVAGAVAKLSVSNAVFYQVVAERSPRERARRSRAGERAEVRTARTLLSAISLRVLDPAVLPTLSSEQIVHVLYAFGRMQVHSCPADSPKAPTRTMILVGRATCRIAPPADLAPTRHGKAPPTPSPPAMPRTGIIRTACPAVIPTPAELKRSVQCAT